MAKLTMEELRDKMSRWVQTMPRQLKFSLDRAGAKLVGIVQSRYLTGQSLGVVTGILRKSIATSRFTGGLQSGKGKVTKNGAKLVIGTTVFYGRIHELELGRSRGHQFLQPAIDANRQMIVNMIADDLIKGYQKSG